MDQIIADRVYIDPESVCINSEGIFLNLGDEWLPIKNLSSDHIGVYVSLEEIQKGFWGDTWTCPKCGYENYDCIGNCGVCGTKKPKK